jgi:hypothetical protein
MISRHSVNGYSPKFYRPLQQLYQTIYGNDPSRINFVCLRRPSEKYKTTNMTYGSFHYDNWAFIQKNRRVNYNPDHSERRCDNKHKQQKMNLKKSYSVNALDSNEKQCHTQLINKTCCLTGGLNC